MLTATGAREAVRAVARRQVSRAVYGDDNGLIENFMAGRKLNQMRRSNPGGARSAGAYEAGVRLRTVGWAGIQPVAPPLMDRIREGYRSVIDDPDATVDMGRRIPRSVRYVLAPHERIPAIRELLDEAALDALFGYYRTYFRLLHCRMWRIDSIPEEERQFHHYGNLWHMDGHPRHTMKIFVQVSPGVSEENGALRLHDIPSTRRITRARVLGGVNVSRPLADNRMSTVFFDGPPGTRLVCNPNCCLHRAGIPARGRTRGMIQLTFEPSPVPVWDHFATMGPDPNVVPGRYA